VKCTVIDNEGHRPFRARGSFQCFVGNCGGEDILIEVVLHSPPPQPRVSSNRGSAAINNRTIVERWRMSRNAPVSRHSLAPPQVT